MGDLVVMGGASRPQWSTGWDVIAHSPHHTVRVISIYATPWQHDGGAGETPRLELGRRLGEFYPIFREQLPRILVQEPIARSDFAFTAPFDGAITKVESWLFALPFGEVVAALSLTFLSPDLNVDVTPTVNVLELGFYAQVQVAGVDLATHIGLLAQRAGARVRKPVLLPLPPERHQIVFVREGTNHQLPDRDTLSRILYRIDPPYRQEFLPVERPTGLNQEGETLGAVTPYVSLLYGHQEYVENSIFLTTVQVVGAAARFRQIWSEAYGLVHEFRQYGQEEKVGVQRRGDLEALVDRLGNLELDLSFSVETSGDLGLLIPSLRIESFHRALYKVMELPTRARTVSQMFTRLNGSIQSEITAIEIRERRRDAIGASVVSGVGVPITFLTALFGINAREVDSHYSMFDVRHYLLAYLAAGALGVLPVLFILFPYLRSWLRARRRRARGASRGPAGTWPADGWPARQSGEERAAS